MKVKRFFTIFLLAGVLSIGGCNSSDDAQEGPSWTPEQLKLELTNSPVYDEIFLEGLTVIVSNGHITLTCNTGKMARKTGATSYSQVLQKQGHYEDMLANAVKFVGQLDGLKTVTVDDEFR